MGYPDGLKGEEIPIVAQVVSIVDVYDALVSPRVYKNAYPHDVAMRMILGLRSGVFNRCCWSLEETGKTMLLYSSAWTDTGLAVKV